MTSPAPFIGFDGTSLGGRVPPSVRVSGDLPNDANKAEFGRAVSTELSRFRSSVETSAFPTGLHQRTTTIGNTQVTLTSINRVEHVDIVHKNSSKVEEILFETGIGVRLANLNDSPIQHLDYSNQNPDTQLWTIKPLLITPIVRSPVPRPLKKKSTDYLGANKVWIDLERKHWYCSYARGVNKGQVENLFNASWPWDHFSIFDRLTGDWVDTSKITYYGSNPMGNPWGVDWDGSWVKKSMYITWASQTYALMDVGFPAAVPFRCTNFNDIKDETDTHKTFVLMIGPWTEPRVGQFDFYSISTEPTVLLEKPSAPAQNSPKELVGSVAMPTGYYALPATMSIHPNGAQLIAKLEIINTYQWDPALYPDALFRLNLTNLTYAVEPTVKEPTSTRSETFSGTSTMTESRVFEDVIEATWVDNESVSHPLYETRVKEVTTHFICSWTFSQQRDSGNKSREHDRTFIDFNGNEKTVIVRTREVSSYNFSGNCDFTNHIFEAGSNQQWAASANGNSIGYIEEVHEFSTGWEYESARTSWNWAIALTRADTKLTNDPYEIPPRADYPRYLDHVNITINSYSRKMGHLIYYDQDWDTLFVVEVEQEWSGTSGVQPLIDYQGPDLTAPSYGLPFAGQPTVNSNIMTFKIIRQGSVIYSEQLPSEFNVVPRWERNIQEYPRMADKSDIATLLSSSAFDVYHFLTGDFTDVYSNPNRTSSYTTETQQTIIQGWNPIGQWGNIQSTKETTWETNRTDTVSTTSPIINNGEFHNWGSNVFELPGNETSGRDPSGEQGFKVTILKDRWVGKFAKDPRTHSTILNIVRYDAAWMKELNRPPTPIASYLYFIEDGSVRKLQDIAGFENLPDDARAHWHSHLNSLVSV